MITNGFDKWFAGFFDGEGTIEKRMSCRGLSVSQSLNPERPVKQLFKKIKKQYGGYINTVKTKEKYRNQLQWRIIKKR